MSRELRTVLADRHFLCCAPDFAEHARKAAKEGELRAVEVDVPHAGRPLGAPVVQRPDART